MTRLKLLWISRTHDLRWMSHPYIVKKNKKLQNIVGISFDFKFLHPRGFMSLQWGYNHIHVKKSSKLYQVSVYRRTDPLL